MDRLFLQRVRLGWDSLGYLDVVEPEPHLSFSALYRIGSVANVAADVLFACEEI